MFLKNLCPKKRIISQSAMANYFLTDKKFIILNYSTETSLTYILNNLQYSPIFQFNNKKTFFDVSRNHFIC